MKSIAVIGAGESGIGAALLAKKNKIDVMVSDYGTIPENYKKELFENDIPFEEKGHTLEKLVKADVIVKSPGIPDSSEVMRFFRLRHKKIISEIEFAYGFYDGNIIGITGSNGKTTTSKLCHHVLKHSDLKIGLGGNIGYSFARMLTNDSGYDWVVLELSSFQLEEINEFDADVSVILNITPDHLDRYDYDFSKYAQAKWRLVQKSTKDALVILNGDDPTSMQLLEKEPIQQKALVLTSDKIKTLVSKDAGAEFEIRLKGKHNLYNAAVAVQIARHLKMSDEMIQEAILSFEAIEHRMETVAHVDGVEFINDSKATNVEASYVALDAVDAPVVWIAGGTDKGNDYSSLLDLVREKVVSIICLTKDDSKLLDAFSSLGKKMIRTEDVRVAVREAMKVIDKGCVLLSPACASFDLFKNYEDRGDQFKKAVSEYINASD